MRVLITRAAPDAEQFAALCRDQGLTPIISPVMEIDIQSRAVDLSDIDALAFTSANGVRAFVPNSDRRDLLVFAVGPVTGKVAREAGFQHVREAGGDVHRLRDHIVSERTSFSQTLLHVAGKDRAGDLVQLLKHENISARRETLYAANAVSTLSEDVIAQLRADPPVEWATFFSPRTAALFLELAAKAGVLEELKKMRAACLSDAVAARAGSANWHALHVAPDYSAASLLQMILHSNAGSA